MAAPATEPEWTAPLAIRAAGLVKSFGGGAPAVDRAELTVEAGELLALLGPSGSGKTTLLRILAGLEEPDAGRVFFGERDVTDVPVQERGIGFVFQHYALFRHLSVFENVAYGLRSRSRRRIPEAAIRERVGALLHLVQLGDLGSRFPAQLSGGQRQRVALARALATRPKVLLLDEPFGALDARVRKDLRRWLRDIHRETGQTTVFVTHDQDEALELADRVAILNKGRIEQIDTPDAIHDAPSTAFVARFVGDSIELPVVVRERRVEWNGHPLPDVVADRRDGPALLSLRTDEIVVGGSGPGSIAGQVRDVRRVARSRRVGVDIGDVVLDLEIGTADAPPAIGAPVVIRFAGGRLFPPP